MKNKILTIVIAIILIFTISEKSNTEVFDKSTEVTEENKLELGAGLLSLRINHYRSSDQFKNYYIPLPYFSYKSDKLEAETSFVRGVFYKNQYFALKLSLSLGLAVESEENEAREDMPDIGYIFEVGPMLEINLWQSSNKIHKFALECPFRKVFATDLKSVDQVGYFSVPYLNYILMPNKYTLGWKFEFSFAVMFGDNNYHNYFYGVKEKYANKNRPEYSSEGGYSGIHATWVGNKKFGNILLLPFIRYDYLKYTVFDDSPLFKSKHFLLFGIGTFYTF